MASRFWVGGTGTWDASDTTHWSATTGGAGGQSVPGSSDTVAFDASSGGGTTTVNTNPTVQSLTLSGYTGVLDFSANNNNITLTATTTAFLDASGTHTLNMGNGTWTVSGVSATTIWNIGNAGLTLNANSSTLVFSGNQTAGAAIRFGGKTYNAVQITGTGRWLFQASSGTFASLALSPGQAILIDTTLTITITNAPTWVGTRAAPIMLLYTGVGGTIPVISVGSGTVSLDWGVLGSITGSGGATFSATNTTSYATNTGWTISTGPSGGGHIAARQITGM